MAEHKEITANDLSVRSTLFVTKKIGGRLVREEIQPVTASEDQELDELLDGIGQEEVEEGRERLIQENPTLASQNIHALLDIDPEDYKNDAVASVVSDPKRVAATKRVGMISEKETGEHLAFRRLQGNRVELTDDQGQVVETISSLEFDKLLDTGSYSVI